MKSPALHKKESEVTVPKDLQQAIGSTASTEIAWKDITPIARRDFITWIESAKQPKTRVRRIRITCDKLASGKRRPCCYAVVPMNLYKALGNNPKAKETWSKLTSTERRDISDWLEESKDKDEQKTRIEKVCRKLELGKK